MSILSTLKNTFLPTAEVSAARRLSTFNTTNKAVVGASIIGIAATAGIGGAAAGLSGVAAKTAIRSAVAPLASSLINVAKANPIKTTAVGLGAAIAAPFVVSSVVSHPTVITKTVAGSINVEKNLIQLGKEPSIAGLEKLAKENPVIVGGAAVIGAALAGKGLGMIGASLLNTAAVRDATKAARELQNNSVSPVLSEQLGNSVTPNSKDTTGISTSTPITPSTQVMGKSAGRKSISSRKHSMKPIASSTHNFRINIINANQSRITSKRYISGY